MKIGQRLGERQRKLCTFIPIKWTHFAVAEWENNKKNNKMKMKMAYGSGKLQDFLKNGFIHCYGSETYKWGLRQSKFTSKDSFVVLATI